MPSSMPVVAIANQKGGVGKTAVTLGLASAAARRHSHARGGHGPAGELHDRSRRHRHRVHSQRRALRRPASIAAEAIVETSWPNVSVIPADLSLAQRDADQQLGAEMRTAQSARRPRPRRAFRPGPRRLPAECGQARVQCPDRSDRRPDRHGAEHRRQRRRRQRHGLDRDCPRALQPRPRSSRRGPQQGPAPQSGS
ncbi:hypothetical protein GS528_28090 [Rhodococcus hoagii]|nr:hypothetical protein [Prescottella equi]